MSWAVWLAAVRVSSSATRRHTKRRDGEKGTSTFHNSFALVVSPGGRVGMTSEAPHRVGRAGNDPPARPFFTKLSLLTDFRCPYGRSWVRSATDAGPIYPAVVAHTGKSTEQRADEARDDDADSEDDATGRQYALAQWKARQAVHLGE